MTHIQRGEGSGWWGATSWMHAAYSEYKRKWKVANDMDTCSGVVSILSKSGAYFLLLWIEHQPCFVNEPNFITPPANYSNAIPIHCPFLTHENENKFGLRTKINWLASLVEKLMLKVLYMHQNRRPIQLFMIFRGFPVSAFWTVHYSWMRNNLLNTVVSFR